VTRPPVEARKATPDDLDDLVLLWSQARDELRRNGRVLSAAPAEQVRVRLVEALAGGESIILVGRYEGAAAGYAVLRLAPVLLVDCDALHIEQLFVAPSLRRRGVGRALLALAASVAERQGAEQVLAGAPPAAKEIHRFLARLGFSPLVVRRVVGTAALRRRLAGEGPRRGLEDLLSRRRSLRARSLRAGWGTRPDLDEADCLDDVDDPDFGPDLEHPECPVDGATPPAEAVAPARPSVPEQGGVVARLDLTALVAEPVADEAGVTPPDGVPGRRRGRQRA
jgi:GNAT superfamily N-acetyltransferase